MPKRETTAVAVSADGSIYAAGVGNKQATPQPSSPPRSPTGGSAAVERRRDGGNPCGRSRTTADARAVLARRCLGRIRRIYPDGHPERVFSTAQEVIYAIGADRSGLGFWAAGTRARCIASTARPPTRRCCPGAEPMPRLGAYPQPAQAWRCTAMPVVLPVRPEMKHEGLHRRRCLRRRRLRLLGPHRRHRRSSWRWVTLTARSGNHRSSAEKLESVDGIVAGG